MHLKKLPLFLHLLELILLTGWSRDLYPKHIARGMIRLLRKFENGVDGISKFWPLTHKKFLTKILTSHLLTFLLSLTDFDRTSGQQSSGSLDHRPSQLWGYTDQFGIR